MSPAGHLYRRLGTACGLAGLLLWAPPAVFGGLLWDLDISCGYVAIVLMVLLYIYPLRGDGLPHARLLRLSQHRVIGWATLGAVLGSAVHVVRCGRTGTRGGAGGNRARRALSGPTPGHGGAHGRATLHLVLAAAVLLTSAAHVIGSGQATAVRVRSTVLLVLLAIPLGWYAVRPRLRSLYSRALKIASAACACGLMLALSVSYVRRELLRTPVSPVRILVVFPHEPPAALTATAAPAWICRRPARPRSILSAGNATPRLRWRARSMAPRAPAQRVTPTSFARAVRTSVSGVAR